MLPEATAGPSRLASSPIPRRPRAPGRGGSARPARRGPARHGLVRRGLVRRGLVRRRLVQLRLVQSGLVQCGLCSAVCCVRSAAVRSAPEPPRTSSAAMEAATAAAPAIRTAGMTQPGTPVPVESSHARTRPSRHADNRQPGPTRSACSARSLGRPLGSPPPGRGPADGPRSGHAGPEDRCHGRGQRRGVVRVDRRGHARTSRPASASQRAPQHEAGPERVTAGLRAAGSTSPHRRRRRPPGSSQPVSRPRSPRSSRSGAAGGPRWQRRCRATARPAAAAASGRPSGRIRCKRRPAA